jgi:hypothetical protein
VSDADALEFLVIAAIFVGIDIIFDIADRWRRK